MVERRGVRAIHVRRPRLACSRLQCIILARHRSRALLDWDNRAASGPAARWLPLLALHRRPVIGHGMTLTGNCIGVRAVCGAAPGRTAAPLPQALWSSRPLLERHTPRHRLLPGRGGRVTTYICLSPGGQRATWPIYISGLQSKGPSQSCCASSSIQSPAEAVSRTSSIRVGVYELPSTMTMDYGGGFASSQSYLKPGDMGGGMYDGTSSESSAASPLYSNVRPEGSHRCTPHS